MSRINELMRQEIASLVQRDFEFRDALVTINGVEVAPDLHDAVVRVGVIGSEGRIADALAKLEGGRVSIQSQVSKRVKLRLTPKLQFRLDRSAAEATGVLGLLDQLAEAERQRESAQREEGGTATGDGETPN